jgi:hypothetical protein
MGAAKPETMNELCLLVPTFIPYKSGYKHMYPQNTWSAGPGLLKPIFFLMEFRFKIYQKYLFDFRYSSIWKGCLTLYTGKGGDIQKVGE